MVTAGGGHGVHSAQGLQPGVGSLVGGVVPQAARNIAANSAAAWIFRICFYRVRKFAAKYKATMSDIPQLERLLARAEAVLGQFAASLPPTPPPPDWQNAVAFRWRTRNGRGWL